MKVDLSFISLNSKQDILFCMIFLILLILFLMNLSNKIRLKRLRIKYNKFMNGLSGRNIEELLDNWIDEMNNILAKNKEMENHINSIERNFLQCVQKVGVVRFNAFDNVGSDLSFAIALLDNDDNGVVISGIYARDSSSTYAKPITGGKSKYALSAEEIKSIDDARKINKDRFYANIF